ncbi:MAG: hypothetical protein HC824_15210 [Synechococcales cyanobacterium RM1_1_8]|nr:hypothetical protein [Synechococcales cyanobacterium RM1_1_8]
MASPPDVPPTPIPPTGPAGLPSGPRNRPPNSRGSCLGRSLRWLALLGLLLAGAGGVASWFLWRYVHRDLAPQIEDQLGNILQRPVELGELESVTPYSIEFGPSTIAPTATDGDRLTTEGVLVNFNLLELLATRGKLKLNVTLQEPDLYLEQDADGNWVATDLNIQPSSGPLEISLNQLQLQGGDVVAVPYGEEGLDPEAKVNLGDVTGRLTTRDNGQQFKFEANGQVIGPDGKAQARIGTNGAVDLSPTPPGQKKPSSPAKPAAAPEIALNIKGRDLLVSDVKRLLENNITIPESEFAQGRLDADLKLILLPNQEAQVAGKVDFRDVTVTVPQLPQPVSQVKGSLTIKDSDIQLQTATGRYGPLPIQAQGLIDLKQGYQLTARVDAFELPQAIDFLEIDLPATVAGRARVQDIVVTGPLETPLIVGQLDAISSVVVDGKVPFKSAASRFTFQDSVIGLQEIRAVPTSGGLISGSGEIVLSGGKAGKDGRIRLDTSADGLSGDDLVNLYSQSTQPFRIGPVNAQARIEGPLTAAKTVIRFQALKGDYPARGQVAIADGKIDIQDVVVRAGGGVARGGAELVGERLRGRVQLAGISLAQFSDELRGNLEGDFTFSGPLDNLGPDSLRAEGIATLSEGISLINEPLTARVNWEGDKLRIGRAAAAGFEASGLVYASFDQGFAIRRLDLDVNAQGLELASLPNTLGFDLEALPVALAVGGTGSFRGKITGKPELPRVDGFVALRQFQVNKFPFESSLDGSLAYTSAGVTLNLSGQGARIALDLDPEFKPRSFWVSQGTAIAQGQRIGPDQLQVTLADFSLAALDFKPAPNISALGDVASRGRLQAAWCSASAP